MRLDFCALCGNKDTAALEHHHFLPRVLGGADDDSNLLTLCGTCHGKAHGIIRPLHLGDLAKAGQLKAQERTADEWRSIARQKARQAKEAAAIARDRELEQAEAQSRAEAAARKEAAALRQEAVKLVVDNTASKPLDT